MTDVKTEVPRIDVTDSMLDAINAQVNSPEWTGGQKNRGIILDMLTRNVNRGITLKQNDYMISLLDTDERRRANPDAFGEVIPGQVAFTATVIKASEKDTKYGPKVKLMLEVTDVTGWDVDDSTYRLYGNAPKGLGVESFTVGQVVSMTANCKASDDDSNFGFMSRAKMLATPS